MVHLNNNNFAVITPYADNGAAIDSGAAQLFNSLGEQIGTTLYGDDANDFFGLESVTALSNNNIVIISPSEQTNISPARFGTARLLSGITNTTSNGSVQLVDGLINAKIGEPIDEDVLGDIDRVSAVELSSGNVLLIAKSADINGAEDIGAIFTINSTTGEAVNTPLYGSVTDDMVGVEVDEAIDGRFYILNLSFAENQGLESAGKILLIRP